MTRILAGRQISRWGIYKFIETYSNLFILIGLPWGSGQPLIIAKTMVTPGTGGTNWRLCAGARTHGLMRHDPMDWTVGTLWTVGMDALDAGD